MNEYRVPLNQCLTGVVVVVLLATVGLVRD